MIRSPKYSVVIPVFNRPDELDELLKSLQQQLFKDFEVIIVEDGSTIPAQKIYEKYSSVLDVHYFFKPNSGPGPSRNFGFKQAMGEYLVIFDSDCILPPTYFEAVEKFLAKTRLDAWGGPDRGHESFTTSQQAMAYTMSSMLTTGGIRGAGKSKSFQPRSYNMGIRRSVSESLGGFKFERLAEDIELSIRIKKGGFLTGLIPEAYVFHKRRNNFSQFFKQVQSFGQGRVRVGRVHPGEIKAAHYFPLFFLLGLISIPFLIFLNSVLGLTFLLILLLYLLAIFFDAAKETRSLHVAVLSIPSAVIQLSGYGIGFLKETLRR